MTMGIQEMAQNNAAQKKGMAIDPNWSAVEREQYIAAYNAAKKKEEEKDRLGQA